MLKFKFSLRTWVALFVAGVLISCSGFVAAQPACDSPIVAFEAFDGSPFNVVSGFDPVTDNLDGGPGDFFGVGSIAGWPQGTPSPGVPFSLTDDSVVSVSTNGVGDPFPGDTEGVFGQNREVSNEFFAISDTRDFSTMGPPTASWVFDITSVTCGLELQMEMGAQANDSNGGFPKSSLITFEYQIDGGDVHTAFSLAPNPDFGDFEYRAMDSGTIPTVGANGPLEVTGDRPVVKQLSDTGELADDTFLNKTPATAVFGPMDRFVTEIIGQGDLLTLTMTGNLEFEAMAFDNIEIVRVPEPASLLTLGLLGAGLLLLRRRS